MPSIMEPDIEPVIFTCCRKARARLSPPQDKTFPETPGVGTELGKDMLWNLDERRRTRLLHIEPTDRGVCHVVRR